MFIDEIKIEARAGRGGRGCIAFHREAFRPKGGPSGGNGGRGGDVILQVDENVHDLTAQYYSPRLIAKNGLPGLGKWMDGRAGKNLVVKVPRGTVVWRLASASPPTPAPAPAPAEGASVLATDGLDPGEDQDDTASGETSVREKSPAEVFRKRGRDRALEVDLSREPDSGNRPTAEREFVADLTDHGQQLVLCQGGRGGLGNKNFATARRQTPRFAQPGEEGDEGRFLFELRIIADIGLVGFPNAGKSTLLSAISHARPRVAPYPFTTLNPQIGIVDLDGYQRLTACDVPGLIEGAHENVGLGHKFLRHIRRCRGLVTVIDMAGIDGRNPWDDYNQLMEELRLYDPNLIDRPHLVAANKMDEAAAQANLEAFKRHIPQVPIVPMAAGLDEGIAEFKAAIAGLLPRTP